jgi:hypothetical protein
VELKRAALHLQSCVARRPGGGRQQAPGVQAGSDIVWGAWMWGCLGLGEGASTRLLSHHDVSVRGELTTSVGGNRAGSEGFPLEWWGAWVGVLVKVRGRWAMEVVLVWRQLVEVSKAVLIRCGRVCVCVCVSVSVCLRV